MAVIKKTKSMFKIVACLLPAAFLLVGCVESEQVVDEQILPPVEQTDMQPGGTAISEILADPQSFDQQEVIVAGRVIAGLAFEFVSQQPYQIVDKDDNSLWIITTGLVPVDGLWITLQGVITAPYQIRGRSYPVVLLIDDGGLHE